MWYWECRRAVLNTVMSELFTILELQLCGLLPHWSTAQSGTCTILYQVFAELHYTVPGSRVRLHFCWPSSSTQSGTCAVLYCDFMFDTRLFNCTENRNICLQNSNLLERTIITLLKRLIIFMKVKYCKIYSIAKQF